MNELEVLLPRDEIDRRVTELAVQISSDYLSKNPLLLCILKGGVVFASDLIRKLCIPAEIDFIRLASYGHATESSGRIKLISGIKTPIKDRHVLIIEDIIDTGLTMRFLIDYLHRRKPFSIRLCTLCDKPSRRIVEIPIDYVGFTVPDAFIVGYGIDWDEKFRCLPDICVLKEQT